MLFKYKDKIAILLAKTVILVGNILINDTLSKLLIMYLHTTLNSINGYMFN